MWSKSDAILLPIILVGIIIISVVLGKLLKDKSRQVKKIPLIIIATILLVLEVIKQIKAIVEGYGFYTLPLHFCSLFMVFFALAAYGKNKTEEIGMALSFTSCLWFIVLFYIGPQSIIGESSSNVFERFGTFHTFFYHNFIILFFALIVSLKLYTPKLNHIKYTIIAYSIYFAVAVPCAFIFDANYCNLLYSNIPFMEKFRVSFGQVPYEIVMYLVGISVGVAFNYIGYVITRPKVKKEKTNEQNS